MDKDVQDGVFKRRIDRVPMGLPVSIRKVELDAAADAVAVINANRRAVKIRPSFAIPGPKLHDLDFMAADRAEVLPEIPGKPARLQLEFVWIARLGEECALPHTAALAQLCVTFGCL